MDRGRERNVQGPSPIVILGSTQDPEPGTPVRVALDPDFRQDDGRGRNYAANSSGSIAYSTAALAVAAALRPIASGTIWSG